MKVHDFLMYSKFGKISSEFPDCFLGTAQDALFFECNFRMTKGLPLASHFLVRQSPFKTIHDFDDQNHMVSMFQFSSILHVCSFPYKFWLVVWNMNFIVQIYWEFHHPN